LLNKFEDFRNSWIVLVADLLILKILSRPKSSPELRFFGWIPGTILNLKILNFNFIINITCLQYWVCIVVTLSSKVMGLLMSPNWLTPIPIFSNSWGKSLTLINTANKSIITYFWSRTDNNNTIQSHMIDIIFQNLKI